MGNTSKTPIYGDFALDKDFCQASPDSQSVLYSQFATVEFTSASAALA
jgi:hypothetical protein